jgi:uncharacterized protein
MATATVSFTGNNFDASPQPTRSFTPEDYRYLKEAQEVVGNALTLRQEWMRQLFDPRRNLDDECGYPPTPGNEEYQRLYEREAIAARVVEVFPKESWQVSPEVYEVEDTDTETAFELAWSELLNGLYGEENYYQDEEGSPLWEMMRRVDILSGIGTYGVLFLGLDDGLSPEQPVKKGLANRLLYLRAFPEILAPITQLEIDDKSPRRGMPVMYSLTFNDPRAGLTTAPMGQTTTTVNVHWTRVIHIADDLSSSEVYGTQRMRAVFNRLLDLKKLYGGSAEMYWRGAFPGFSFETHPQMGNDVKINQSQFRDMIELWQNGLQRYLTLFGMSAKSLAPQVVDPTPQIIAQIEAICIRLGIPKRIFMGSERGELASTQDDKAWNDRMRERQAKYLTPRLVVPFVNRLISIGVLPKPKGFSVWWPDLTSQSDLERADVALKLTGAISQYAQSGADTMFPLRCFLTLLLQLTDEEADYVLAEALKQQEGGEDGGDQLKSPLLGLVGGVTGALEMFKAAGEGILSEDQLKKLLQLFFKISEEEADDIIGEGLTDAAVQASEATPEPGPEQLPPMKVKEGERLVNPNPLLGNK